MRERKVVAQINGEMDNFRNCDKDTRTFIALCVHVRRVEEAEEEEEYSIPIESLLQSGFSESGINCRPVSTYLLNCPI